MMGAIAEVVGRDWIARAESRVAPTLGARNIMPVLVRVPSLGASIGQWHWLKLALQQYLVDK